MLEKLRSKKAFFFTVDAAIALVIIFLSIIVIYPSIKYSTTQTVVKSDMIDVLSALKTGEIDNAYVQGLISSNVITDKNKTILEQIGEFYVLPTTRQMAIDMANEVFKDLNTTENIGIWFDNTLIYYKNQTPMERARYIEVDRQIVTGVKEGNLTGYSARAYLMNTIQSKYYYLGGYIGDGNITLKVNYNGTINSSIFEGAGSDDFDIYVNNIYAGNCSRSESGFEPKNCTINVTDFQSGNNFIEFRSLSNLHISGGFIKILYETNLYYNQTEKYNFPGINGLINIYDGFYIPNNLNYMNLSIKYNSTYNLFLSIGNKTIFTENSSGEIKTLNYSDADLRSKLNYNDLIGKTVPLRLGLENISGSAGLGIADIVFIVDSTQSMEDEINDVYLTIENFTKTLNNSNINYRLGLIDFKDFNTAPCGMSSDYPFKVHNFSDNMTIKNITDWKLTYFVSKDDGIDIPGDYITLKRDITADTTKIITAIDQGTSIWSAPFPNNYTEVYEDNIVAQTFTPSYSGNLTNVLLRVSKIGNPDPIVIEIRNTTGGIPGNDILESIEFNSINTTQTNIVFNFSNTLNLTSGILYSIYIKIKGNTGDINNKYLLADYKNYTIPASGSGQNFIPEISFGSPYSRGTWCNITDDGTGPDWNCPNNIPNDPSNPNNDLYFRTNMTFNQTFLGYVKFGTILHQYNAPYSYDWYDYNSNNPYYPTGTSGQIKFRSSEDNISWSSWSDIQNVPNGKYLQQNISLYSEGTARPLVYTIIVRANFGPFTNNLTKYQAAVDIAKNSVVMSSGNDGPESHLMAINVSLDLSWRNFAKKFIVVLSDNMTHAQDCILNGGNTDNSCNKGPKKVSQMIDQLVNKQIAMFYINNIVGLCDNYIFSNMTNMTNGKFYPYDQTSGVRDIITEIAGRIVNISYSNQTAVIEGGLSTRLYPDSFIEFSYNRPSIPYGLAVTIEEPFDNDEYCNYTIPSNSTIVDTKVISYSSSKWTNDVSINDQEAYNLSRYNMDYLKLGDPFVINIPADLIIKNNSVKLHAGLSAGDISAGSIYNKVIYKAIKNFMSYSQISPSIEGCNWHIQFYDDSLQWVTFPSTYTGGENCAYMYGDFGFKTYYSNDAYKVSVYKLLSQIDFDNDGKVDVKFTEENLDINSTVISGIPVHFSTEVQVRRWY